MSEKISYPYKSLGQKLRLIRQKLNESVEEVSGAVEIDQDLLECIEKGIKRPDEDILLLLINHFGMKEDEADLLWKLANYERPVRLEKDIADDSLDRNMVLVMALDPRVIYSDSLSISANKSGVVLNFSQTGDGKRPMIASRIGMSYEQAKNVLYTLQQVVHSQATRQLPPSTDSGNNQKKDNSSS